MTLLLDCSWSNHNKKKEDKNSKMYCKFIDIEECFANFISFKISKFPGFISIILESGKNDLVDAKTKIVFTKCTIDSETNGTYRCDSDAENGIVAIWDLTYLKIEEKNKLLMDFSNCFQSLSTTYSYWYWKLEYPFRILVETTDYTRYYNSKCINDILASSSDCESASIRYWIS